MIIEHLYETKIECSDYNPKLYESTNDVITVTVTLVDFNKENVTNKSVVLTTDKGYFKSAVGKTIKNYTGTSTRSITLNTDANGQIKATYAPSDAGLCTFSANNTIIQCFVKDYSEFEWEEIYPLTTSNGFTSGMFRLYVNHVLRLVQLVSEGDSETANFKKDYSHNPYPNIIPNEYRPSRQVVVPTVFQKGRMNVTSDGSIYLVTTDYTNAQGNANCTAMWHY